MTPPQLCRWAETLETEDVCDLCAAELFSKTKHPLKLAARWVKHPREMTRRAGFGVVCALAAPRAKTAQADLLKAFALLKNGAADPSPFVYKTVNKALKMLGKKMPPYRPAHWIVPTKLSIYLKPTTPHAG